MSEPLSEERDMGQGTGDEQIGGGESTQESVGKLFEQLVQVMAALRGPKGCPWDKAQTHESIKRNTIEEAYEVASAIEEGNYEKLKEELGD
ncbi:MAG: hypothetical protein OGMRLDGQ_001674, partial [Candidatus Fervidibacter sp.]